jgi:hypothetical protein
MSITLTRETFVTHKFNYTGAFVIVHEGIAYAK